MICQLGLSFLDHPGRQPSGWSMLHRCRYGAAAAALKLQWFAGRVQEAPGLVRRPTLQQHGTSGRDVGRHLSTNSLEAAKRCAAFACPLPGLKKQVGLLHW